jgi:uncharacterized protein (TIGR03000 family)
VRDGQVFVLGRDQITCLHDLDGDGEADFYENFCNLVSTSTGGHEYVTSLEKDDDGNFYFVDPRGLHRISRDGRRKETLATGFRNPNGIGVSPDGKILTVAPQQGEWTPSSALCEIRPGGYYGYGYPGRYGYGYGYGYGIGLGLYLGSSPYYYGSAGNYYDYPSQVVVNANPVVATEAFSSPASANAYPTAVRLTVVVPDKDVQVWLDGSEMQTRGPVREFVSPPLDPTMKYSYHVRAKWQEGDKVFEQVRKVPVTPGQMTAVDFTTPEVVAPKVVQ